MMPMPLLRERHAGDPRGWGSSHIMTNRKQTRKKRPNESVKPTVKLAILFFPPFWSRTRTLGTADSAKSYYHRNGCHYPESHSVFQGDFDSPLNPLRMCKCMSCAVVRKAMLGTIQ